MEQHVVAGAATETQPGEPQPLEPRPSRHESGAATLAGDDVVARVARRFRAVSEPTRVRILELLARRELTVGEVARAAGVCASVASRHLGVLADAHWVVRARDGATVIYKVTPATAAQLAELLDVNAEEFALKQPPPPDPFDIASQDPDTVAFWVDWGTLTVVPPDNEYEWNHTMRHLFGDVIGPHLPLVRDACLRLRRGDPCDELNLQPAVVEALRALRAPDPEDGGPRGSTRGGG